MKDKIVYIEWQDARSFQEVMSEDELLETFEYGLAKYECIGFLVKEDKNLVMIALGRLPKMYRRDEILYRNILLIPRVQITKIQEVTLKNEEST